MSTSFFFFFPALSLTDLDLRQTFEVAVDVKGNLFNAGLFTAAVEKRLGFYDPQMKMKISSIYFPPMDHGRCF